MDQEPGATGPDGAAATAGLQVRPTIAAYRRFLLIAGLSSLVGLVLAFAPVAGAWRDWAAQPASTEFVLMPAGHRYVGCGPSMRPYPEDPLSTCGQVWQPAETTPVNRGPFEPQPDWARGLLAAGVCYLVVAGVVLSARALKAQ